MENKQIVKREATLIIDERGRAISTRIGQYSDAITIALAKKHNGKQVSVRDIVRCQFGRMNPRNEQYVRRKLYKAVNTLLESGIPAMVIYEEGGHRRVKGIKVITQYDAADVTMLEDYMESAVLRGQLSQHKAEIINSAITKLKEDETNGE